MYKRLIERANYRHLVYYSILLVLSLAVASIIVYWQSADLIKSIEAAQSVVEVKRALFGSSAYTNQQPLFIIILLLVLALGVSLDIIVHVAKRDGYKEGYKKGFQNSSVSSVR